MRRGWRIGRIAGVDVFVDPSWGVIAVLLVVSQWTGFSDRTVFPGLSSGLAVVLAALTTLLFFASVLAHELAHAIVSKLRGIPVRGITLYLFGGATHAERAPASPLDEFVVTVVGPVTNLLLGGILLAVHVWGHGIAKPIRVGMLGFLALENVFLGGFNLLPGFPLDGGRVLRAAIWRVTGNEARATRASARGGQAVAALVAAAGIAWAASADNFFVAGWAFLIAWFIFQAATAVLGADRHRDAFHGARVRDVMAAPPPVIEASMGLADATERYLNGHDGEAFPVVMGHRIAGFVSLRTARAVSPGATVADAMVEGQGVLEAGPAETVTDVLRRAGEEGGATTVLVVEDGRLIGVIEPEDLKRFMRQGRPAAQGPGIPPPPIPPPPPTPPVGADRPRPDPSGWPGTPAPPGRNS
jgi:Zn-dependent protease